MPARNLKEYNQRYYLEHRDELLKKRSDRRYSNQEEENKGHRKRYRDNLEKERERNHKRYIENIERERQRLKENSKKYAIKYPDKMKARQIARNKKLRGNKCGNCGTTDKLEMHHPDYSKPEEIITLCSGCHGREHWKDG